MNITNSENFRKIFKKYIYTFFVKIFGLKIEEKKNERVTGHLVNTKFSYYMTAFYYVNLLI